MGTVRIEIPYYLAAEYVPQGKRKPLPCLVGGRTAVEVPDLDSSEAPKAVTWTDRTGSRDRGQAIYAWNGGYWAKDLKDDPVTRDTLRPTHLHFYGYLTASLAAKDELPEAPGGRIVSVDGYHDEGYWERARENAAAEVEASAAEYVFIDGDLCRRTQLPVIKAVVDYRMRGSDIVRVQVTWPHEAEAGERENIGAHGMLFHVTSFDEAMEWAKHRVETEREAIVWCDAEVEVHLPGLEEDRGALMRNEALRICTFMFRDVTRNFEFDAREDGLIGEWMAWRRAIRAAAGNGGESETEAMIDATASFYRVYAEDEDRKRTGYGSSFDLDDDFHYKAFEAMRRSWNLRPVAMDVEGPSPRRP